MRPTNLLVLAIPFLSLGCPTTRTSMTPTRTLEKLSLPAQPGSELEVALPRSRELQGGQSHEYKLLLGAAEFARIDVAQSGMDLAIAVRGPGVSQVFDTADGDDGPEIATIASQTAGTYIVEVRSREKPERKGTYSIVLQHIEALAQDPAGRSEQILARWDREGAPGLAVAVARNGNIVYQRVLGSAQLEHGVALSEDSVFQAASVAKQFTAFAIFMLADKGQLSLDDDVRTYIPELPDFGHTITVRHLLHHQSGLRDQWALMEMSGGRWDDRMQTADVLEMMSQQRELDFVPGSQFSYSNTGYTVLAEVVARVTGSPFRVWAEDNLFAPLGMTSTRFVDDMDTVVPRLADSYSPAGEGFERNILNQALPGPTSLYTTTGDLIKWLANLDSGTVGGRAVLDAVQKRSVLDGAPMDYAGGLYHGSHRGLSFVGHSGAHAGYRTSARRYPEHGLSVVVLANNSAVHATRVAAELAEAHLREHVVTEPEKDGESAQGREPAADRFDADSLDAFVGVFKLPGDLLVEFVRERDQLLVVFQGARLPLERASANTFTMTALSAKISFEAESDGDGDGLAARVVVDRDGQIMRGERLPFEPPSPEELRSYVGRYVSPELLATFDVTVEDDHLVARQRRKDAITLAPADKDAFAGDAWYFGRAVFERDQSGAITAMLVSGTRARNVRFVRQARATP